MGRALITTVLVCGCIAETVDEEERSLSFDEEGERYDLLVTDRARHAVLRYDSVTGALIEELIPPGQGGLEKPTSVRLGPDGALYVTSFHLGEVLRYTSDTGDFEGVFYHDMRALEEPVELFFHGDDLFVLGNDTQTVVVLSSSGELQRRFGHHIMHYPQDFLFDSRGRLLVSNAFSSEIHGLIQVWDVEKGELIDAFGDIDELGIICGMALGPNDLLYVCDFSRNQILRYDSNSGELIDVFIQQSEHLVSPITLELGPDGDLYIVESHGISRFDGESGEFVEVFIEMSPGELEKPYGLTFSPRLNHDL